MPWPPFPEPVRERTHSRKRPPMTDSESVMEGSANRIRKLIKSAAPSLLLVGALAVAGCGGGGGDNSAKPPAPVNQVPSSAGRVVSADATQGLVGPAGRATSKSLQFDDAKGKISPKANHKTNAQ